MARYFIEIAYKGTAYSGFQVQENATTIQSEVEKAFQTLHRHSVQLTGSSRTDAGVHACQNFFHFDFAPDVHSQIIYKLNAVLPGDIVVKNVFRMPAEAHSRFDATSRAYVYHIHQQKSPFLKDTSLYYPFKLDFDLLQKGAAFALEQENFFAFSKTNSQVKNFRCRLIRSEWEIDDSGLHFHIEGNRFLRGMVRLLTATLLKLGRGKLAFKDFESFFTQERKCGFSTPAHGLFLQKVAYPENYFTASTLYSREF